MPAKRTKGSKATTERLKPTGDNPLAEPTPQRRLWALRIAKGFSRYKFAKLMGVSYSTVDQWDLGSMPSVEHIAKAAHTFNVSTDDIIYGAEGRKQRGTDPALSDAEITHVLEELKVPHEPRSALGEYLGSHAARFQTITRLFVIGFVQTYTAAREAGASPSEAREEAADGGFSMQARAQAVSTGGRVVTTAELRADARESTQDHGAIDGEVRERAMHAKRPKPLAKQLTIKRKRRR